MAPSVASRRVQPRMPAAAAGDGVEDRGGVRERDRPRDRHRDPDPGADPDRDARLADADADAELPPWLDAPPPEDAAAYDDAPLAVPMPGERSAAGITAARDAAIRVVAPAAAAVRPAGATTGAPTGAPAGAPASPEPVRSELGSRWAAVVGSLVDKQAISALVRELALQAELVGIDDTGVPPCWRLRVERESLRAPALRDKLQAALAEAGVAVRLELEAGVALDSPALRDAALRRQRQREAERLIADDPLLRELMAQFDTARIVPGSVRPH